MTTRDLIKEIRAKIEWLYDGDAPKHDQQCDFDDGYFTGIGAISKFLDVLENTTETNEVLMGRVKAPSLDMESIRRRLNTLQESEVDFEKEWEEFENWMDSYDQSDYPTCYSTKQIAKHFFELGLKAQKGE